MKKSMGFAGLLSLVVALVLSAPAVAQQGHYTINVQFSFNVNAQVLPAGEYDVCVVATGAVQIRGVTSSGTFGASRLNQSPSGPKNAQLVFHRYGRQYFLSQVWFAGFGQGYELPASNAEREYAKQIPKTETVLRAAK
jgi:hypothetical protein